MTGLNMIAMADENGKTYECKYGTYNKEKGFTIDTNALFTIGKTLDIVNKMLHEDIWTVKKEVVNVTLEDVNTLLREKYGDNYKLDFEIKLKRYNNNDDSNLNDLVKEFIKTL